MPYPPSAVSGFGIGALAGALAVGVLVGYAASRTNPDAAARRRAEAATHASADDYYDDRRRLPNWLGSRFGATDKKPGPSHVPYQGELGAEFYKEGHALSAAACAPPMSPTASSAAHSELAESLAREDARRRASDAANI